MSGSPLESFLFSLLHFSRANPYTISVLTRCVICHFSILFFFWHMYALYDEQVLSVHVLMHTCTGSHEHVICGGLKLTSVSSFISIYFTYWGIVSCFAQGPHWVSYSSEPVCPSSAFWVLRLQIILHAYPTVLYGFWWSEPHSKCSILWVISLSLPIPFSFCVLLLNSLANSV